MNVLVHILTQNKGGSKHATMAALESRPVPPVHIAFPSGDLLRFFLSAAKNDLIHELGVVNGTN